MAEVRKAAESRVDKPWGYEIRWAITDRYLGKILHINAGEALSLQYHRAKDECILIVKGEMDYDMGDSETGLERHRLCEGDTIHVTPGTRHRMTAVTECEVFEVSTPEIDDVVRLDDRYGRAGT